MPANVTNAARPQVRSEYGVANENINGVATKAANVATQAVVKSKCRLAETQSPHAELSDAE